MFARAAGRTAMESLRRRCAREGTSSSGPIIRASLSTGGIAGWYGTSEHAYREPAAVDDLDAELERRPCRTNREPSSPNAPSRPAGKWYAPAVSRAAGTSVDRRRRRRSRVRPRPASATTRMRLRLRGRRARRNATGPRRRSRPSAARRSAAYRSGVPSRATRSVSGGNSARWSRRSATRSRRWRHGRSRSARSTSRTYSSAVTASPASRARR